MKVTQKGRDWFKYSVENAQITNPLLIQNLVAAGYPVVQVEEIQRSLESVYLQAVNQDPNKGGDHVE